MLINNELVLLIFQLELDAQLQRMLIYENYDAAQEVRARRQAVDEAWQKLLDQKVGGSASRKSEATDLAAEGLGLRSEMQRAVEEERYQDAAKLRDRIKALEAASADARALAAEWGTGAVGSVRYRLGQRVKHQLGYRAVVAGWDDVCCESPDWQERNGVPSLTRKAAQPFYHLLVDVRDWPPNEEAPPIAYVAEELLEAPEEPSTWLSEFGGEPLQHPYKNLLFLGVDGQGDLLPVKQLREKFCVARRNVYAPGEEEAASKDEDEDEGKGKGKGEDDGRDGSGI